MAKGQGEAPDQNNENMSFQFKQFAISQDLCAMKVGTDGVLLGAWAEGGRRILDVGCGTGIISLMMAQRFPEARITALDIMDDCCRQARANADSSPWGSRIEVVNSPMQSYSDDESLFDSIVSNPPFFVGSLKNPDKGRAVARHADSLPFSDLAKSVARLLSANGCFSVIIPNECLKEFVDECWFSGLYLMEDISIKTKENKPVKRHLLRFSRRHVLVPNQQTVILTDEEGNRSHWYQSLTGEFYL